MQRALTLAAAVVIAGASVSPSSAQQTGTVSQAAGACPPGTDSYGQASGCFQWDPCGRVAPFNNTPRCGSFDAPFSTAGGVVPVTCSDPCPFGEQCGATLINKYGGAKYQRDTFCFVTCAQQGATSGTVPALMTPSGAAGVSNGGGEPYGDQMVCP
jgi:hypothetical protein